MKRKLPDYCMAHGCNPWQREEEDCCDNCELKQTDGIIEQVNSEEELGLF